MFMASHSCITFTEAYLKIAQDASGKNVLDLLAVRQKVLRLAFQAQWESKWIGWNMHVGKIKLSDKECSFYFMVLLSLETSVDKTKIDARLAGFDFPCNKEMGSSAPQYKLKLSNSR
ncbi:hypothetical protein E2320_014720 [Naja naja]|nr:hypothetical protein E2320_014720 [Naja naja]